MTEIYVASKVEDARQCARQALLDALIATSHLVDNADSDHDFAQVGKAQDAADLLAKAYYNLTTLKAGLGGRDE